MVEEEEVEEVEGDGGGRVSTTQLRFMSLILKCIYLYII